MTEEKPTAAFILSLIAGFFIILGGGVMTMAGSFLGRYGYGMMRYGGMMGTGLRMMGFGVGVMGVLGLVFGVIVIISAFMLNSKPDQHQTWGSLIVLFSALSIFGSFMGFGVCLVLGLIGGILAMIWQPKK